MTEPTQAADPVTEAVYQQFKEDVGNELQPNFNIAEYRMKIRAGKNTGAEDIDYMLRQKYGLLPPQLSHGESNLIRREEIRLERS